MSKLKNLFFVPVESVSTTDVVTPVSPEEIPMGDLLQRYEQEFDKLNLEGSDFYEFMKAVNQIDNTDPKTYQIVQVTLGLKKDELFDKAKFYVSKLQEFHVSNDTQIKAKINEVKTVRATDTSDLQNTVRDLTEAINLKQAELDAVSQTLREIDTKHQATEDYLVSQVKANDLAKSTMVGKITTIVEGIKQFIK